MDPVSDIVALLRPHAVISKPITGRGGWGVAYAAYEAPGFSIVLKGRCWLSVEGADPIPQERGDFVLFPSSPAFSLVSDPGVVCVAGVPSSSAIRHGDPNGEPDFEMLGGSFRLDRANASLILALLPRMIYVRAQERDTTRLARIIGLIMEECTGDRLGRDVVLRHLLEIMLVECLRLPEHAHGALPSGLLAGMQDPALGAVLRAMHADVKEGWSVAALAKLAGMSRSSFSARFSATLGCSPMEYLARWRMTLAQDALSRGGTSLEHIAEAIGYESASAFSTAFRRRIGCSPGTFARSCRADTDTDRRS